VRTGICSSCDKQKKLVAKCLCWACYQSQRRKDPSKREQCSKCGETKQVAKRTPEGKAICPNCYQKHFVPVEQCSKCGETKQVAKRTPEGKAICPNCYQKHFVPVEECSKCGETKQVAKRTPEGKAICLYCHRGGLCPLCGKKSLIAYRHPTTKQLICGKCRKMALAQTAS